MEFPFYIIGLGNPGPEYAFTRHNAGFMVVDLLARIYNAKFSPVTKCQAQVTSVKIKDKDIKLIKPMTFMNRSGQTLKALDLNRTESGAVENMLVVFDDVYLPLGAIRYREKGSPGGHNGMKSIVSGLDGSNDFHRLRIGVGNNVPEGALHDYVLGVFKKSELEILSDVLDTACESIEWYLENGIQSAMNRYNSKVA